MVISTNQNRQFYLAKRYADGTTVPAVGSATSVVGDLGIKSAGDGIAGGEIYFTYQGVDGAQRSDFIQLKNLSYAKAVKASDMAAKMKKVELTLDPNVNGGVPVSGQDYILRVLFWEWVGISAENQYYKDAAVHATSTMTASDFYKALVKSLNLSFSREVGANSKSNPYLRFAIGYGSGSESEEDDANWASATATKVIIEEKEQDWSLGTESWQRVNFDVQPTTIYTSGSDYIWGEVQLGTPTTTVNNGKQIADLEWFCMGERGDQYRYKGWPNYVPTKYLVDESQEYSVIELHFAFTDTGVNSYRSEKDITIAVPNGAAGSEYDVINDIIGAINTEAGTNIATLQ